MIRSGRVWFGLVRWGDWLTIILAVAATAWLVLISQTAGTSQPIRALVRSGNRIVADIRLPTRQRLAVDGPLGQTLITVEGYRMRIEKDPGPRQYCVMQGWLSRSGDIDICLPNRVSIQLQGQSIDYDSFHY